MSKLAVVDSSPLSSQSHSAGSYNKDQIDLIKRTIAKDHTDDELKLFLAFCFAKGLDPFSRQVYSIKRSGKMTFQMAIDGIRSQAEDSGEYDGQECAWCGQDGIWKDVWLEKDPPAAARVVAYRKGCAKPFTGIARWDEYKPTEDFMWRKMPALMISKVAEALALRKAFPGKLGGIYGTEEMAQASHEPKTSKTIEAPVIEKVQTGNQEETVSDVQRKAFWAQLKKIVPAEDIQRQVIRSIRGKESTDGMTPKEAERILTFAQDEYGWSEVKE